MSEYDEQSLYRAKWDMGNSNKNNDCAGRDNRNMYCCETIKGNNVDVDIHMDDCEVRSDIVVGRHNSVRLWGRIKDCDGKPVGDVMLKLVKMVDSGCGKPDYVGVAHSLSDCAGFYQFDIPKCDSGNRYKVIVGKAAIGKERVLSNSYCDPCEIGCVVGC